MAKGRKRCRTENKATEVSGKLFFNESTDHPKSSMRQAAKRFAETDSFDANCRYYDAEFVDGRWQFTPVGNLPHQ